MDGLSKTKMNIQFEPAVPEITGLARSPEQQKQPKRRLFQASTE